MKRFPTAFTLIELLIVVAIIGILAAIAVPNFLNAQTRAKVAKVRSELRSLSVALDSYRLDRNQFPWPFVNNRFGTANHVGNVIELTTPISYIASVEMQDPFINRPFWQSYGTNLAHPTYVYVNYRGKWGMDYFSTVQEKMPNGYGMTSHGPDATDSGGVHWPVYLALGTQPLRVANTLIYEGSNGLKSKGDIVRYGGDVKTPPSGGG